MNTLMKPVIVEEIEFYVSDDGTDVGISISGLARLCGVSHQTISKLLKNYYSNIEFKFGKDNSKLIPEEIVKNIILNYIAKGHVVTKEAYNLVKFKSLRKNIKINQTENVVRNKLHKQLNGQKEVITLAGNIDLLTATEIIEVKHVKSWKHALGQVLVYSMYYPSHQKRIHLFGNVTSSYLDLVTQHCSQFNVTVTCEI